MIVGDGPKRAEWEQLARELGLDGPRHASTGEVSPTRSCAALMHACAALVLPSVTRAEAFGYVQLEAMACGEAGRSAPTSRAACRGSTRTSAPGWSSRAGDAGALRAAHRARSWATPRLRARLGAAGRARVERGVHARAPARAAARCSTKSSSVLADVAGRMLKRALRRRAVGRRASSRPRRCGRCSPPRSSSRTAARCSSGRSASGCGGRTFDALKFRSMRPDAEALTRRGAGDRARSARHAHRPAHARDRDGRAAAAVEHPARRHELRRAARAAAGRDRGGRRRRARAARGRAGLRACASRCGPG